MIEPELLNLPGNNDPVECIWVFVSVDEHGHEGICGAQIGDQHFPMITSTRSLLEKMRVTAKKIAKMSGKPIRLYRFTNRELVETITAGMN